MNIIVSGKGISITQSMRAFIDEKLTRLERYWAQILQANVEVTMSHHHKHGEVYLAYVRLVTPGNDVRASSTGIEFHAALDSLMPKLERLVIKAKERHERR